MENPVSEPILTPVQVPEQKSKFPVIPVLLVILLLLLASTAFLFYQNMQLKNMLASYQTQPIISPTPTTYQSPVPTGDPTVNWKTYTNTQYGFFLKYPNSLPSFKTKIISTSDKPFYVIRESFSSENFGVEYGIEIAIWDNPSKSTLQTWLESMKNAQVLDFPALPIEDSDLTSNYVIDGKEALRFWSDLASKGQEPGNCEQACPMNEVYVAHENKVFRILFGFSREVNKEDLETLNQILSTFRFIK